jgi:uncharacterized protein DUF547
MPSAVVSSSSQRRSRRWRFLLLAIAIAATVAIAWRESHPMVLVGRPWPASERVAIGDVSHQAWDELLHRYVDADGFVDYAGWKQSAEDSRRLEDYLAALSRADEITDATVEQRLAFWINAYNAVSVRGILREYPTSSIQNHVAHVWGYNIWRDLKLIVGDRRYSLGEIEHAVLRKMNEPRIHFAIVCASRGCPRLLNEAYSAERLEEQLSRNTFAFFADSTKCSVDAAQNELQLSPILNWFAADFGTSTPAVLQRIADWLPESAQVIARSKDVRVKYFDYDWSLNDQATAGPPLPPF